MDYRDILAKNIAKYRKKRGLAREELSLLLGFDNSYISKLEKGKITITITITIDRLILIARYLEVEVSLLFIP